MIIRIYNIYGIYTIYYNIFKLKKYSLNLIKKAILLLLNVKLNVMYF